MYKHSVMLDETKCKGCTNCIKRCPTEAIRVKKGRAMIIAERCIDCGECIRVCPYHAKKAVSDSLSMIQDYDFKVAIPAPALYGQFPETISINKILTSLKYLGFDDVFEVARSAEIVTEETIRMIKEENIPKPAISSSCPVIVRIIQNRFPSLIPHILPLLSPMEVSARIIKNRYKDSKNKVAVFFISPCSAKVTAIKKPRGFEESAVDGVIGIKDLYLLMNNLLKKVEEEDLSKASSIGISWARTEGESAATGLDKVISVDGIKQCISVLESIVDGKLADIDFIEMMSCPSGCVGGPMVVENPYIARTRIKLREYAKGSSTDGERELLSKSDLLMTQEIEPKNTLILDKNIQKAVAMMEQIEKIEEKLPGLDCGSCGSPTCHTLAEDIVKGKAVETECAFVLREKLRNLTEQMIQLENISPPGLDKDSTLGRDEEP